MTSEGDSEAINDRRSDIMSVSPGRTARYIFLDAAVTMDAFESMIMRRLVDPSGRSFLYACKLAEHWSLAQVRSKCIDRIELDKPPLANVRVDNRDGF